MDKIYVEDIQQLAPQGQLEVPLTPDTIVLCIHRGRRQIVDGEPVYHPQAARYANRERERFFVGDYKDTYDGQHFLIAPGYFRAPYGAALHFQKRAVVPGSRNPESGFQASFIAIIGITEPSQEPNGFHVMRPIDDAVTWPPFSDEECRDYEIAGDALDRGAMVNPIERDVQIIDTNEVITGRAQPSRVKGGGAGRRNRGPEATDPAILKPIPADENRVLQEARASAAEREAGGS